MVLEDLTVEEADILLDALRRWSDDDGRNRIRKRLVERIEHLRFKALGG